MYLFCFILLTLCRLNTAIASSAAGQETLIGVVGSDFVMLGADSSVSQSIALTCTNMDKIYKVRDTFPHYPQKQTTILAAAAGDNADVNRMIRMLTSQATVQEYESCIGHDVEYISIHDGETIQEKTTTTTTTTGGGLSVEAVARLARSQIAASLRSQSPFQVCLLVAGMQPSDDISQEEDRIESCYSSHLQQQIQRASRDFVTRVDGSNVLDTAIDDATVTDTTSLTTSSLQLKPRLYWLDNYGALQKLQYGAHGLGSNFLLSILDQGFSPGMSREEAVSLIQECFRQLKLRFVINSPQLPCIKCVDKDGCHVIQQ